MAFLALFLVGRGDPTTQARQHGVILTEAFKHLVKFAERLPNGKYSWRFASLPRFPYWALDMKQRHQLLSQSNVYLHQHPADPNMTIEELREMAMTIHKSHGQTLPKVVVDLGKGEKVAGCTLVATSRVRSINDIVFQPMTFDHLRVIGRNKNMQKRIEEERRLMFLSEQTLRKYGENNG